MAYCPPGSICGMLSIPRALPPVTHGSALQAPERIQVLIFTTDYADRTDECPMAWQCAKHKPEKPLGEDGGLCPDVMLPPWSYKSELLTPKPEAYHHLPSEGHHPHQGYKQE